MSNKQSTAYKKDLVKEIISLAKIYGLAKFGEEYIHPNENTNSSIIFYDIAYNFHPKSWQKINQVVSYKARTTKRHSRTITSGLFEMQSSNSSDALAMNIFCFPDFIKWKGVLKVFEIEEFKSIDFGVNPRIKKIEGGLVTGDSTEADVVINNSIIIECKLTEDGFYEKDREEVEKYIEFKKVFHIEKLRQDSIEYLNYQLIRNILAAHQINGRFILLCDMRRPDLVKSFYHTVRCIKDDCIDLRTNCEIIYWQDIAKVCGTELQQFLKEKYGIC